MVKKILSIAAWIITGAALIVLFVFAYRGYIKAPLQGVTFNLEREGNKGFVEKDTTIAAVETLCKISQHNAIGNIDMLKVQKLLASNPWIESASAYIGLNDTLVIQAKEYKPILRIFDQGRHSVYVTAEGVIIPTSPKYTPRLIIASGHYTLPEGVDETLAIAKAIQKDEYLTGSIGQIYRNSNKQYEIMVNSLPGRVIVGDTTAIDNKLSRLHTLLEKYNGTEELMCYKTMDLRYKNQIVCTK